MSDSKDIIARSQARKARAAAKSNVPTSFYQNGTTTQGQRQLMEMPVFKKYEGNPIIRSTEVSWFNPGDKLYFPSPINVREIKGDAAIDTFYMYFSTDHASGASSAGGIGLFTAPHPLGPWTDRGRVYVDAIGSQTETPCVIWNEVTNLFHMYYHNNTPAEVYRNQASTLATSPDGINWTRVGPVIMVPDNEFPGDGHTGYMRVYRVAGLWIAHHLMGGTNNAHGGISYSRDGIKWQTDPRPTVGNTDLADTSYIDRKISITSASAYPFIFKGNLWSTYLISNWVAGGAIGSSDIFVSPFKDPRKPLQLTRSLSPGAAGTWDELSIGLPWALEFEGKLYMFYEGTNNALEKCFGVAIAEVV